MPFCTSIGLKAEINLAMLQVSEILEFDQFLSDLYVSWVAQRNKKITTATYIILYKGLFTFSIFLDSYNHSVKQLSVLSFSW